MSAARLVERLRAGETLLASWHAIPEPLVVEAVARAGFDVVVLDMQHGHFARESVMRSVGAAALAGKPAIVRVPVGGFGVASWALDAGAEAVIAPMVNSTADAAAFVEAMKYPPLGGRSWGPGRAMTLRGERDAKAFLAAANSSTLSIAMIETRTALAALGDIVAMPGIDSVFVGPWDMSVSLSDGKTIDAAHPAVEEALAEVVRAALAAGKIPATLAPGPERARAAMALGYRLIAVGGDSGYIADGVRLLLAECRA
jgi:4-hydroxy-2-oxoheptanedioate aldolase